MKSRWLSILLLGLLGCSLVAARDFLQRPADPLLWSRGQDIPLPRGGYYASWYHGGLLIAGGTYWRGDQKLWTDNVSYYDPARKTWVNWPSLPMPLAYGVSGQVSGKLYLITGMNQEQLHLDVLRLDGKHWTMIGTAPEAFIYGGAAVVGRKIYLFGGGTSITDLTTATRQSWSFDPISLKWERLEDFPGKPRVVPAVVSLGSSIFLFGGATQSGGGRLTDLDDAYRFDTLTRKWNTIKSMSQPSRALWATNARGSIYLFGGVGERTFDTVYRYDPRTDQYQLVSHLPAPLLDVKFFFHNGFFYGATGEDKARSRFPGLYIARLRDTPEGGH
jgi:N-acetylneuraminic acid mutarotase